MATITWTKNGDWGSVRRPILQRSGDFSGIRKIHVDDVFNKPLSNDELDALEILLLRHHASQRTMNQLAQDVIAGIVCTIGRVV